VSGEGGRLHVVGVWYVQVAKAMNDGV
jgi:hypothetical protein